ncbi:Fc.00g022290.m01.CDS01 [Cosmosporella sp. VM-42]
MPSPNLNPAGRDSAPYGHACVGCSKAKCRCIGRGPGNSCERCHRLSRDCEPSGVLRKRLARRPATKAARIEEKLDDLVTLLKTQAVSGTSASNRGLDATQENQVQDRSGAHARASINEHRLHSQPNVPTPPFLSGDVSGTLSTDSSFFPSPSWINPLYHSGPTLPEQAGDYLETFRRFHLKTFPFVHIPPEVTAAQLQRERPFLWLNIRAFCCKSVAEKNKVDKNIRQILAQSLLVDSERSLDLLLGLLAYLAWTMDHGRGKKMLCIYSSLAASLVFDLRLDRPGQEHPCRETESFKSFGYPIRQYVPTTHRTNEERRAVLACFATCSVYVRHSITRAHNDEPSSTSSFLNSQTMRWTPHMEDCLQHLANEPQTPGDELLVAIVKISKVMDDATTAASWRFLDSETYGAPKVPPVLHVKSLSANLEATKATIPPAILETRVVRSYVCDTTMMINNLPLSNAVYPPKMSGLVEFGKSEYFYACIQATQQGLDNWFSFGPEELFGASMALLLHFGRYTHNLYRLAMTENPGWDRAAVLNAVDLIQTLERGAELVGSVPESVGLYTDGSDFFTKSAATLRSAVPIWKRTFAESGTPTSMGSGAVQGGVEAGAVDVASCDFVPMDFSDDAWLTNIFTSWESC